MPEPTDTLLFKKLVASESESSLEEVADACRPEASEKSLSALFGNDSSESTYQTALISDGIELNSRFDSIDTS